MQRTEIQPKSKETTIPGLTERQLNLARQLGVKHGRIKVTRERSGLHFYMPSPEALRRDGAGELHKLHLAVNVDKFEAGTGWCGVCHKYETKYTMDMLLDYPSLLQRDIKHTEVELMGTAEVDDSPPAHPGDTMLLTDLYAKDPDHAVFEYLKRRGYTDLRSLVSQFNASYCFKSNPEIITRGWHKTGFITEPAGRLIFFIMENDAQVGWQGRTLDFWQDGVQYMWFEQDKQWVGIREKVGEDEVELEPFKKLHVVRYYLPPNSRPSAHMMGYDAALRYNKGKALRWMGICEGPFDAARVGAPFCAVMGKHFNSVRAEMLVRADLDFVFVVCDNDNDKNEHAGEVLWKDCNKHIGLGCQIPLKRINLPPDVKDLGDMSAAAARKVVSDHIAREGLTF